jgi:serine protease Do
MRARQSERGQPVTLTSAEAPPPAPVPAGSPDVASLVARVSSSVVSITATQEVRLPPGVVDPFEFFFGGRRSPSPRRDDIVRRRGLGSGVILDAAGHVVTNAHVVQNATKLRVTLADARELDAKLIGKDERLDVAVLELQGAKDLPHASLGQSDALRVGDYVVAIGNPFGLGHTVTMGIVSAKGRELGAGPYDDFIQTDASINPGNSGGPLFDLRGQVVGINTAIAPAGQGIGFAIPSDALKDVLPQLLEKGSVSRGRLGVSIQTLDAPLAKALGLDKPEGALVAEVEPGSPAEKAGLQPREVVVAIDGTPVVRAHDLPRLVARRKPGTRVALDVIDPKGRRRTLHAVLDELREERPDEPRTSTEAEPKAGGGFGLSLGDARGGGAVVRGVEAGSPASESLLPGDVVVEIDDHAVKDADDANARLRAASTKRPPLLHVKREGRDLYVALERK